MICSSCFVPGVVVTRACVSPRVKRAEPCVRGRTLWRISIGRTVTGVAAVDAGFAVKNVRTDDLRFEFEEDAVNFVHVGDFRAGGFGVGREGRFDERIDFAELFRTRLLWRIEASVRPASAISTMRA